MASEDRAFHRELVRLGGRRPRRDAVSAKLTTAGLTKLNAAVSGNSGVDPDQAARGWLQDNGFDTPIAGR
jgi:hypothetical protein